MPVAALLLRWRGTGQARRPAATPSSVHGCCRGGSAGSRVQCMAWRAGRVHVGTLLCSRPWPAASDLCMRSRGTRTLRMHACARRWKDRPRARLHSQHSGSAMLTRQEGQAGACHCCNWRLSHDP